MSIDRSLSIFAGIAAGISTIFILGDSTLSLFAGGFVGVISMLIFDYMMADEERRITVNALYQMEASNIDKFLITHTEGHFRLSRSKPAQKTAYAIVYPYDKASDKQGRTKLIQDCLSDLSEMVSHNRKHKYGLDSENDPTKKTRVSLDADNHVLIVPRVDPDPLRWHERKQHWKPKEYHAIVGRLLLGTELHNAEIDLSSDTQFSMLIGGSTGSGKTMLIRNLLLSAAHGTAPDKLHYMFVDIGGKGFQEFKSLPHTRTYATTDMDALALLRWAEKQMTGADNTHDHRTVIIIDELQRLTQHESMAEEFKRLLRMIASMGRGYGINIIIATQQPAASVVPTFIRDNCVLRIAGRCARNAQSAMILGDRDYRGASLSGSGSFVLEDASGRTFVFNSFLIDNVQDAIGEVIAHWYRNEIASHSVQHATHNARLDIPLALLQVFDEYADHDKLRLRYGGMSAAVAALNGGESVPGGRLYNELSAEVNGYLQQYFDEFSKTQDSDEKIIRLRAG